MNEQETATASALPADVRNWAMACHLGSLTGVFTGIGFFAVPLVLWLVKRETHPFIDEQGKEAVNFQFTMMLAMVVCVPLIFIVIGIFLLMLVWLVDIVLAVVGGIKAANGESFRYPLTIRFLK